MEFDKELKFEKLRSLLGVIMSVLDICESNAEKKVADKELTNGSSNDTSKSRVVRIIDLVNQSKKGSGSPISKEDENNIVTESDKGFLHDVIMTALDTRESNAEKKVADKKRKSLEVWPVIAASAGAVILGVVAYFRHQKSGVVYREHRNR
ncbi:hypothetical protein HanIR_Chr01g0042721 [Helianthus annuus]|nr:hypothetical protein HanIR_Chr01g0042721 [Helianthus annuus]